MIRTTTVSQPPAPTSVQLRHQRSRSFRFACATSSRERWTITVEDNGTDARPFASRVKIVLKIMLRSFGLRCTDVSLAEPSDTPPSAPRR